jgi:hypothetical protein
MPQMITVPALSFLRPGAKQKSEALNTYILYKLQGVTNT